MGGIAAICAAIGGAYGAFAAPALAGRMLAHKRSQIDAWWYGCLAACAARRAEDPACSFDAKAKGEDGALGVWYEDTAARLKEGSITDEQAGALVEAGIVSAEDARETETVPAVDEAARFAAPVPLRRRIFWGVACAAAFGCISMLASPASAFLASAAIGILVVIAIVDAAAHIAPFELAFALYPVALAYAFARGGAAGAAEGAACAAVALLALLSLTAFSRALSQPDPIGWGDVRLLPACAMLVGVDGAAAALVALCALPLLAVLAGAASGGGIDPGSRIAMCPTIAAACAAGLVAGLL